MDLYNSNKNHEGYSDPTASEALKNIDSEKRVKKLLKMIFELCELSGFRLQGRITLVDKRTNKVWK